MTYNGELPGPTLKLRPGDLLKIKLLNSLGGAGGKGGAETNLHVHGLHVSPNDPGDNVFRHVMAGDAWDYVYEIRSDHRGGLFWYHPHRHGQAQDQVHQGMAGAIIVEGDLDDVPWIRALQEHLLVIQGPFDLGNASVYLVNGQINPTIQIRPGEWQRWRVLNATADKFMNLKLEGQNLHRVALDGKVQPNCWWTTDVQLLGPAERAEFLVQGGPERGDYQFHSAEWDGPMPTHHQPVIPLATLICGGTAASPAMATLPKCPSLPPVPYSDLNSPAVSSATRRKIVFDAAWSINGKFFDEERIDGPDGPNIEVKLGSIEEWIIHNDAPEWHNFHLHINDFQVVAVNDLPPPEPPHRQDTVPLPPNSTTTIRVQFINFPGKSVYHCHILFHEDNGMMAVVNVVE